MYTQVFGRDPRPLPAAGTGPWSPAHRTMHPNTDPRCLGVSAHGRRRGRSCGRRGSRETSPAAPAPAGAASTLPSARPHTSPTRLPASAARTARLPGPGCAGRLGPTCFSRVVTSARGGPGGQLPPRGARPPAPAGGGRKEAFSSCLRRGGFDLLHLRAGGRGRRPKVSRGRRARPARGRPVSPPPLWEIK